MQVESAFSASPPVPFSVSYVVAYDACPGDGVGDSCLPSFFVRFAALRDAALGRGGVSLPLVFSASLRLCAGMLLGGVRGSPQLPCPLAPQQNQAVTRTKPV